MHWQAVPRLPWISKHLNVFACIAQNVCNCIYKERTLKFSNLEVTENICKHSSIQESDDITSLSISNSTIGQDTSLSNLLSSLNLLPSQIRRLSITNTDISSISVNFLANLEYLDLRNNQLAVLKKLELPKLKQLYLSGNPWTCFIT